MNINRRFSKVIAVMTILGTVITSVPCTYSVYAVEEVMNETTIDGNDHSTEFAESSENDIDEGINTEAYQDDCSSEGFSDEWITSGSCGEDISWSFDKDTGILSITGSGKMDKYDGKDMKWQQYANYVTGLHISDGVTGIGENAFMHTAITGAILPDSVETIGGNAFYGCDKLITVLLPNNSKFKKLENGVFYGCKSLNRINIPKSLEEVCGTEAVFWKCPLSEIEFEEGRTKLPDYIFQGASIVNINSALSKLNGSLTSIGKEAFMRCTELNGIALPDSVETIGESAFRYCESMDSVMLSKNLKRIDNAAFDYCTGLNNVRIFHRCSYIGADQTDKDLVFHKCDNMKFICDKGTFAHRYARLNDIPCTVINEPGHDYSTKLFDLTTDGYPLINIIDSFGNLDTYTGDSDYYRIVSDRYKEIYSKDTYSKELVKKIANKGWIGNCFGMMLTAAMFDKKMISFSDYKISNDSNLIEGMKDSQGSVYDKEKDKDNNIYKKLNKGIFSTPELLKLIDQYQAWQKSIEWKTAFTNHCKYVKETFCIEEGKDQINMSNYLEDVIKAMEDGELYLISMDCDGIGSHALLNDSCRYPEEYGEGVYRVYLYDCNYPYYGKNDNMDDIKSNYSKSLERYIDIDIKNGEWHFNDFAVTSDSAPVNLSSKEENGWKKGEAHFIKFSIIQEQLNKRPAHLRSEDEIDSIDLSFDAEEISVRKSDEQIYCFENGTETKNGNVINIPLFGDNINFAPMYYKHIIIPNDDYTIDFKGDNILVLNRADYIGISQEGNSRINVKLVDSTKLELKADKETQVSLFLDDMNCSSSSTVSSDYVSVSMNVVLGTEPTTISLKNNSLSVDTPNDQKLDVYVETSTGSKEIKDVTGEELKKIDITEDISGNNDEPIRDEKDGIWIDGMDDSYSYTGTPIKPDVKIYDGNTLLREKVDYTIAFKNNTKVYTLSENEAGFDPKKAPSINITGKGNYDSKEVVYFKILPVDIGKDNFSAYDITLAVTGNKQKVTPALYWNGKALKNKTDYDFDIYKLSDTAFATPLGDSVTEKGEYVVRLTGKVNFTGTRDISLTLTSDYTLISKLRINKLSSISYTGSAITPEPEIMDGSRTLIKDVHYTLSYSSNVNVGTGYVIVTGVPDKGYAGTKRIAFKITGNKSGKASAYDISETKDIEHRITVSCVSPVVFMKGGAKPAVTVTYKNTDDHVITLVEGRDYKLSYKNNNSLSVSKKPVVVITGTGNYKGKRECPFVIEEKAIDTATLIADDVPYKNRANSFSTKIILIDEDGKELKAGKDYNKIPTYTYLNETVISADGKSVIRAAGSAVEKNDIIPVNTMINVTVNAIAGSGYTKSVSGTYKITEASISSAKVSIPDQTYTGKPIKLGKSTMTVTVKGQQLKESDFEIVSCTNNIQKGTAKVTIRGIGNYGGLKIQSFKIKAKGFKWWWRKD